MIIHAISPAVAELVAICGLRQVDDAHSFDILTVDSENEEYTVEILEANPKVESFRY